MVLSGKKVAVIVNPISGSGKTAKVWPKIERSIRQILPEFAVFETGYREHATKLTRQALRDGYDHVISVGGDGTHHEVLNGFFEGYLPINAAASMSIVPTGTGSDLARTLGLYSSMEGVPLLETGRIMKVDVGRATFTHADGSPGVRYFINVADFGAGGAVVERVNRSDKRLGGKLSYMWAVLMTVITFRSPFVRIQIDGELIELKCLNCIMANGQFYGSGIHVARDAKLDSGNFEVLVIKEIPVLTALRYLPRFYDGTFVEIKEIVTRYTATRVVAESQERVLIDLDGEGPGQLPLAVELLPGALNLVVS